MSNTKEIIRDLQNKIHNVLLPLVPQSGKFALLDFPNYGNIGDSAIWLGEIDYFKNWHNIRPAFVSNIGRHSSQQLKKALPEGPIFLSGGGNFGDLWPIHQDFRDQILSEFLDRKIIQLPQSLHFNNLERLKKSADIINAHPDFTLIVRDHKSYALAKEHFKCTILMCPDMAFAMGPQQYPSEPISSLLLLLRMDKERNHESVGNVKNVLGDYRVEDWPDEDENLNPKILRETIPHLPQLGLQMLNRYAGRELFYRRLAQYRLSLGLKAIGSARFIISDRLHTHILSVLLDRPHIVLDNSYGKISNFVEAWTSGVSNMSKASTLKEAIDRYNTRHMPENEKTSDTMRMAS